MTEHSANKEIVEIVDRDNRPCGTAERRLMRREGLTHRATYILVINRQGQLFIQKRTATKDIYPGYWEVAAGGVVLAGESYEQSAQRELAEELGINNRLLVAHFDHYYEADDNKVWGRVFTCLSEGPFILQAEEVAEGRFVSPSEVFALSRHFPFTPDGLEILQRLLGGDRR